MKQTNSWAIGADDRCAPCPQHAVAGCHAGLRLAISRTFGGACSNRYSFAFPNLGGCRRSRRSRPTCGEHDLACLYDAAAPDCLPVERSPGTRPRYAMSWRGLSNRLASPTSVTNVTAAISLPRAMSEAPTRSAPPIRPDELFDHTLQLLDPFFRDAHRLDHLLERDLIRDDRTAVPEASVDSASSSSSCADSYGRA